jgi:hypothetical protein
MAVNSEKVEELVQTVYEALEEHAEDASAGDLFSAMLTIGYRAILSAKQFGCIEACRPAIEKFYAELPPQPATLH